MIMTKNELATFIAGEAQVKKKAAAAALGTLVTTIQEALGQKDGSIRIPPRRFSRKPPEGPKRRVSSITKENQDSCHECPPVQPFQVPEGRGEGSQVSKSAMNKLDLIEALSKQANLPLRKADEITRFVFDTMSKAVVDGDRIEIRGFGSFMVRDYQGYTGRNPKSGENITVLGKRLPSFKTGKELKEKADGKAE